jgi:hypothetical protein
MRKDVVRSNGLAGSPTEADGTQAKKRTGGFHAESARWCLFWRFGRIGKLGFRFFALPADLVITDLPGGWDINCPVSG